MDKICENCCFYAKYSFVGTYSECRRYPPTMYSWEDYDSRFPIIQSDYWCGEFKEKIKEKIYQ